MAKLKKRDYASVQLRPDDHRTLLHLIERVAQPWGSPKFTDMLSMLICHAARLDQDKLLQLLADGAKGFDSNSGDCDGGSDRGDGFNRGDGPKPSSPPPGAHSRSVQAVRSALAQRGSNTPTPEPSASHKAGGRASK